MLRGCGAKRFAQEIILVFVGWVFVLIVEKLAELIEQVIAYRPYSMSKIAVPEDIAIAIAIVCCSATNQDSGGQGKTNNIRPL